VTATYPVPPAPFLQTIIHDLNLSPPLAALCAGYEAGEWREKAFAEHLVEWLPEFSLSSEELRDFHPGTAVRLIRKAAKLVYQTDKYGKRGEFGELLLHIALRQIYQSIPAISKIFYKDSVNSTVKGFDAVHVVEYNNKVELWLGEVKFYDNANKAIYDVIEELEQHTKLDYLRNEFILITNKLDKSTEQYGLLSKLLDQNTSLDEVFDSACIPVLITYDSPTVKAHTKTDNAYKAAIQNEALKILENFNKKSSNITLPIRLHIFMVPLHSKATFISQIDKCLKALQ